MQLTWSIKTKTKTKSKPHVKKFVKKKCTWHLEIKGYLFIIYYIVSVILLLEFQIHFPMFTMSHKNWEKLLFRVQLEVFGTESAFFPSSTLMHLQAGWVNWPVTCFSVRGLFTHPQGRAAGKDSRGLGKWNWGTGWTVCSKRKERR